MNRREMLAGLVASAAAVDVAATASVIEAEPKPLLIVLKINHPLSSEAHIQIRKHWAKITEGKELPPLVILDRDATLEAVVDPREVKS